MSDPGHAEPTVSSPAEWVSQPPANGTVSPLNTSPRISDDGNVVVFDSNPGTDVSTAQVMIRAARHHHGRARRAEPPPRREWRRLRRRLLSVPVAANQAELVAFDRCDSPRPARSSPACRFRSVLSSALPAPALSVDGRVIVVVDGRQCGALRQARQRLDRRDDRSAAVDRRRADRRRERQRQRQRVDDRVRRRASHVTRRADADQHLPLDGGAQRNPGNGHSGVTSRGRISCRRIVDGPVDLRRRPDRGVSVGQHRPRCQRVPTVPPGTGALATYVVLLDLGPTPTATPTSRCSPPTRNGR